MTYNTHRLRFLKKSPCLELGIRNFDRRSVTVLKLHDWLISYGNTSGWFAKGIRLGYRLKKMEETLTRNNSQKVVILFNYILC